jgi:hypothetical protein
MKSTPEEFVKRSLKGYQVGLVGAYAAVDGLLSSLILTDSINEALAVCGCLPTEILAEVFKYLRDIREGGYLYRPVLIGATERLPDSAWQARWKRLDDLITGNSEFQARLSKPQ